MFKKGEKSVFKKHFLQKSVDNKVRMKPLEYILIVNLNMTSTGEDEFMNGPEVVVCGSTSEYIVEYYTLRDKYISFFSGKNKRKMGIFGR